MHPVIFVLVFFPVFSSFSPLQPYLSLSVLFCLRPILLQSINVRGAKARHYDSFYMYISSYFEIPVDTGEPCDAVEDMTDVVCGTEVKKLKIFSFEGR